MVSLTLQTTEQSKLTVPQLSSPIIKMETSLGTASVSFGAKYRRLDINPKWKQTTVVTSSLFGLQPMELPSKPQKRFRLYNHS